MGDAVGFYHAHLFESAAVLGARLPSNANDIIDENVCEKERYGSQPTNMECQSKAFEAICKTQLPSWACTVKNTFIEFEDNDSTCASSDDELLSLTPSLEIIPKDVISHEKLNAYRLEYQRFRAGGALGAKGELCSSAM